MKTAVLNSMSLFRADAGTGDLNRILYLRQMDLISAIKMCRLKRGISVTIDFVHEDMNTEGLVMIPFAEDDMIWEIGLLTLKDRAMESSVEKFYKYIEKYNS